jgi:hypothetical protein
LSPIIKLLIENKYSDEGENFKLPAFAKTMDEAIEFYLKRIKNGSWRIIENKYILGYIKRIGYDAILTIERGSENIAVFDPSKITIVEKKYI